ncbi:hypothetical protein A3Q32_06455 [Alcanivorax sp. KX64203]|nr:hypothetical protein A3Q32_06455 [Alcanivorax sp. KX64203]
MAPFFFGFFQCFFLKLQIAPGGFSGKAGTGPENGLALFLVQFAPDINIETAGVGTSIDATGHAHGDIADGFDQSQIDQLRC